MFKILFFLVITFFFFIIFSFSHIFYLFGSDFIGNIFARGGYEGIKSSIIVIYGIFFGFWLVIYFLRYKIYKNANKILKGVGLIIFGIIISTILSIDIGGSIIGLSEKYHGLLFFMSLLTFFTSVYFGFEKEEYRKVLNWIFTFSIIVYIYAFIQFIGLDPLSNLYDTRVSITRATSFLGNANYLAGYILILLPLSKFINIKVLKNIFILFSFLALVATGSYFGIFLGVLYFLYLLYSINKTIFAFSLISFVVFSAFLINSISIEKQGSLLARPYIWETSITAIVDTPKTILFGYGPDTLQLVFDRFKVPELSVYETSSYTADRTHNMFLDFIYFFGLFGGGFIIYFLLKSFFITKNKELQLSILLFILFFGFNIPISIHYILILLILAGVYSKNYKKNN